MRPIHNEVKVNGFRNGETANIALLLQSTQALHTKWKARAFKLYEVHEASGNQYDLATLDLADEIKAEMIAPIDRFEARDKSGYLSSLMRAAFAEIDFIEVAGQFTYEVQQDKDIKAGRK